MVKGDTIEEGCFRFFAKKCMSCLKSPEIDISHLPGLQKKKKAPEFNPVSSKVWISIISEFWIDEILCKLYVQEMHMLFLPANQSFYKTSTSKITLNCIFTASLRPTRNPCKKNALT